MLSKFMARASRPRGSLALPEPEVPGEVLVSDAMPTGWMRDVAINARSIHGRDDHYDLWLQISGDRLFKYFHRYQERLLGGKFVLSYRLLIGRKTAHLYVDAGVFNSLFSVVNVKPDMFLENMPSFMRALLATYETFYPWPFENRTRIMEANGKPDIRVAQMPDVVVDGLSWEPRHLVVTHEFKLCRHGWLLRRDRTVEHLINCIDFRRVLADFSASIFGMLHEYRLSATKLHSLNFTLGADKKFIYPYVATTDVVASARMLGLSMIQRGRKRGER